VVEPVETTISLFSVMFPSTSSGNTDKN